MEIIAAVHTMTGPAFITGPFSTMVTEIVQISLAKLIVLYREPFDQADSNDAAAPLVMRREGSIRQRMISMVQPLEVFQSDKYLTTKLYY